MCYTTKSHSDADKGLYEGCMDDLMFSIKSNCMFNDLLIANEWYACIARNKKKSRLLLLWYLMLRTFEFNSLWHNEVMWRYRTGPTLAQVMACCLMTPSHYLNQCWLIIRKVQWIDLRAISQNISQPSTTKIGLKKECYLSWISLKLSRNKFVKYHVLQASLFLARAGDICRV